MDEEVGVKVTRLRRRMSVEQSDDGKSSAPSTPVKKRGRKVLKPELELIDENETNSKKLTKKTIVKEITDNAEEKSVTPSRRSARIKSNTSIISDTILNHDSPRAKRAARRNSQAGSDTDMPITPARLTRRTRKDSTSSIEKEPTSAAIKTTSQIPEVITEEPENITKHNKDNKISDTESNKQSPIRKSPRLLDKKSKSNNSSTVLLNDDKSNNLDDNDAVITFEPDKNESSDVLDITSDNKNNKSDCTDNENTSKKDRLSISSTNLIMNLETHPKKMFTHINKSLTEAQELNKVEPKRHRNKSWTTLTAAPLSNEEFYSDNEKNKKKLADFGKDILKKKTADTGFGDSKLNNSKSNDDDINENIDNSQNDIIKSKSSAKKKKTEKQAKAIIYTLTQSDNGSDIQCDDETTDLFKTDPSNNIHTSIVIEDSDSNSIQVNIQDENVIEDQCVPVVNYKPEKKNDDSMQYNLQQPFKSENNDSLKLKKGIANQTCEPMDVDETLPESLINNLPGENVLDNSQDTSNNISINSKRKTSLNILSSQTLEKSGKENKSTLILSQLKDLSTNESKSPALSNNKQLSNSVDILNVTHENIKANNKQSANYLTSTPLQPKSDTGSNTNSNIFNSNISNDQEKRTVKKKTSLTSNEPKYSLENCTSDEDSSNEKQHELLMNEAAEANDSYESGDSQDEEEKQYEKDNEILEKGETLTTEDELSNDSDYDKDSFLVSSDEEDNELLSGSGDDLSMSDNELKMTTESKKKYNERKLKEQKKASKEMFESRHCSNKSSNANKSKLKVKSRQRLESSQSEDDVIGPKKNNRMRLNSSANEGINKSDEEISIRIKKGKETNLLETSKNILREKENTTSEEAVPNLNDPLMTSKIEQKTPKKESRCSVGFVDTEFVNDTPIANTMSNLKSKDPLENSYEEDSSSTNSEDMNITQNYDKMLEELKSHTEHSNSSIINNVTLTEIKAINNSKGNIQNITEVSIDSCGLPNKIVRENDVTNNHNSKYDFAPESNKTKKTKTGNHSMNFEKKPKKMGGHSIVDKLNITEVKEKFRKKKTTNKFNETEKDENDKVDDSSDSIDLKLLFSEDSINSRDSNKEFKENVDSDENVIPLKTTEAKTNIKVNEDGNSGKEEFLPFFVDTMGNHCYENEEKNVSLENNDSSSSNDSYSDESPDEISIKNNNSGIKKEDKKTPNSKNEKTVTTSVAQNLSQVENTHNKSVNETLVSNVKSKKRISESFNVSSLEVLFSQDNDNQDIKEKSLHMSFTKKTPSKVLESNKLNTEIIEAKELINDSVSKPNSDKKKKKILSDSPNKPYTSIIEKTPNSDKKKKGKLSQSLNKSQLDSSSSKSDKEIIEQSLNKEKNEKRNYSLRLNIDTEDEATTGTSKNESIKAEEFTSKGDNTSSTNSKGRKRKSSATCSFETTSEGEINHSITSNDAFVIHKKLKVSQNSEDAVTSDFQIQKNVSQELDIHNTKTKCEDVAGVLSENKKLKAKKNLKRKNRDNDDESKTGLKVLKQNSLDQVHIPRLPISILNNLEDKPNKPKKKIPIKTSKVIATTEFKVEETKKRQITPSNYLEESIYINEEHEEVKKQKGVIKNPKVLPFIPTASISNSGYTTNFKVNVLPQAVEFVAQSTNVANFKNDYLYGKKIKRLGTYDLYKKNRNIKMSKF